MQILVREMVDDKLKYVWKKVYKKNIQKDGTINIDGRRYYDIDILKIKGDLRNKYSLCRNCGELIKPEDAEKHFEEKEKAVDCLNCSHLIPVQTGNLIKKKLTKNENGTYMYTLKQEVRLNCNAGYYKRYVEEVINQKDSYCPHFRCRNMGIATFYRTILMEYPKMNEVLATERSLIENKFVFNRILDDCRIYNHIKIKNLNAFVDRNGVVKYFEYIHRGNLYRFIYAKEYDKFFSIAGIKYKSFNLYGYISDTTIENIQKAVREVYKEES